MMCRWAAYLGEAVFLEEIVSRPCHSLIRQSHCAEEARSATNADGFGLAWYADRPDPGLYRDILPAWSDPNLKSLCGQIRSGLFLAHVRAATSGATARFNCHPFVAGRWSFMHNGEIGGFEAIRRRLESGLSDTHYDTIEGTTDSELFFRMMLDRGLDTDPEAALASAVADVLAAQRHAGLEPGFKLTAAFADGERLFAVRYAAGGVAPTLYTAAFGNGSGRCLVSEPFDREGGEWHAIPPSSMAIVSRSSMTVRQFAPARNTFALAS